MAFGQSLGPPATRRQIDELLALLHEAGHTDFRDARGPMGFTQRQSNGKFTRDEADGYIEELLTTTADGPATADPGSTDTRTSRRAPVTAAERREAGQKYEIHKMSSELLAAELQQRGWAVIEP